MSEQSATANTEREIWREREGDFYSDSIHVTRDGGIGIDVGGHVIVMPAFEWHALATGTTRVASLAANPAQQPQASAILQQADELLELGFAAGWRGAIDESVELMRRWSDDAREFEHDSERCRILGNVCRNAISAIGNLAKMVPEAPSPAAKYLSDPEIKAALHRRPGGNSPAAAPTQGSGGYWSDAKTYEEAPQKLQPPSEDQIMAVLRKVTTGSLYEMLTCSRWKDGIDITGPTYAAERLAEEFAALGSRSPAECAPQPVSWRQSDEAIRNMIAREIWRYQECEEAYGPFDDNANEDKQLDIGMRSLIKQTAIDQAELIRAVVLASPAVKAAVARMTTEDEMFEIGKRDGYEDAIQTIDVATGGDGEFRGSTDPSRVVDVPAMQARIIDRFKFAK